jgi:hypothetical protein
MTISNKYNAGFCVLTIKVVGYAHVIWFTKKMVKTVFSINFKQSMVVNRGSFCAKDSVSCTNESGVGCDQLRRIEPGVANTV